VASASRFLQKTGASPAFHSLQGGQQTTCTKGQLFAMRFHVASSSAPDARVFANDIFARYFVSSGKRSVSLEFVKKYLGKLLFPRLQRDERDRRMNSILVALTVGAVVAVGVGLGIWLYYRNHPF